LTPLKCSLEFTSAGEIEVLSARRCIDFEREWLREGEVSSKRIRGLKKNKDKNDFSLFYGGYGRSVRGVRRIRQKNKSFCVDLAHAMNKKE